MRALGQTFILSADEAEGNDLFGLRVFFQDVGAMLGGGTGGEDVVDEENAAVFEARGEFFFQHEGVFEIDEALLACEASLGDGVAGSPKGGEIWIASELCEVARDFFGLISPTLDLSATVEGDRNEDGIFDSLQTGIVRDEFREKVGEVARELKLAMVFDLVDEMEAVGASF